MRAHLSCRSFIARLAHMRQFVAEPLDCSQIKLPDLAGEDIQREQPQERKTNQNNLRISKGKLNQCEVSEIFRCL